MKKAELSNKTLKSLFVLRGGIACSCGIKYNIDNVLKIKGASAVLEIKPDQIHSHCLLLYDFRKSKILEALIYNISNRELLLSLLNKNEKINNMENISNKQWT